MASKRRSSRSWSTLVPVMIILSLVYISYSCLFGGPVAGLRLTDVAMSAENVSKPAEAQPSEPAAEENEGTPAELAKQAKEKLEAGHFGQAEDLLETIVRQERRSYEIKMMSREIVRLNKYVVIVLAIIAISFPMSLWLLSRRRLIGLSGLSSEVAATLLVVEERQAKLANILKEIQGEMDYLHTMSVPDLKKLIEKAEQYIQENEQDLAKSGLKGQSGHKPD